MISDVLHDLVPFVQFKNVKNIHGGVLLAGCRLITCVTLLHGCFSRFLNCANGTESRNVSHAQLIAYSHSDDSHY